MTIDLVRIDLMKGSQYIVSPISYKRWDLQALLSTEKVDVVAITETFLSADILNSELVDETSFTVFRRDRNRDGGGGLFWCFEMKSLLSAEMTLRLIVNFYG